MLCAAMNDKPTEDHVAYPPRGMDAERAARHVGTGKTKFLEMVDDGRMPQPFRYEVRPCVATTVVHDVRSVSASTHGDFYMLALYTGQRRGDCCAMRWTDFGEQRRKIFVVQEKTGTKVWVPVHKRLYDYLVALAREGEFILTSPKRGAIARLA
jgi:integrase